MITRAEGDERREGRRRKSESQLIEAELSAGDP